LSDGSYLAWPWFEDRHRAFAAKLDAWAAAELPNLLGDHEDVDAICPRLVAASSAGVPVRAADRS